MGTELSGLALEIETLEQQIGQLRLKLGELRRQWVQPVESDYAFTDWDGRTVGLAELFGEKQDLIVVHNMGAGCSYCTLWADGFNGVVDHLNDRAAFVLVSEDSPAAQQQFAAGRGWRMRMVSSAGTSFFKDMGFLSEEGHVWPGTSTFHQAADGTISRVGKAHFGPGDDFCSVWYFFDLLKDGANDWHPKYQY